MFLLQRRRHVLMNRQPLTINVFKNDRPAKISHFYFPCFVSHFIFHGGGSPDQVAMRMNLSIIVNRELRALVTGEDALDTLLILVPAVVLQRRDVEKGVRSGG